MLLANVIFPAPSAVYVSSFFIPLATIFALATELFVFSRTQRGIVANDTQLLVVIVLNVFSWVVGIFTSGLFPTGLVPQLTPNGVSLIQPGPNWNTIALLSFPFACILSTGIEYLGLRLFFHRIAFYAPLRTIVLANITSYLVLSATVFVALHFEMV